MAHNYEKFNQALRLLNARLELTGAPGFNLVICGGTALAATGLVPRTTTDVDIVALLDDEGKLLCLLGASNEIHPADIARQTGYFARTTQNALAEMARSGVVEMRTSNREKMYWLKPGLLDNLPRPDSTPTPWVNWSPLFRALEILWLGLIDPRRQKLDPLLLASELRRLTSAMRPLLGEAGWGMHLQNEKAYRGEEYSVVFMQDIKALLEQLNHNR